jgi:hypothetical protein
MTGRAYPRKRANVGEYRWFQTQLGRITPGYSADPDAWTPGQIEEMFGAINRGALKFYNSNNWSFLRVKFALSIRTSVQDYPMGEEFGGIHGKLSYDSTDSGYQEIRKVSPGIIYENRALNTDVSSYPNMYAERWSDTKGNAIQVPELMFWPKPDGNYTLHGEYDVNPRDLDEEHPYGYGGRMMAEAMLASMAMILNPAARADFEMELAKAVERDNTHHRPQILGKNLNKKRGWPGAIRDNGRFINQDLVTYNSGS